MAIPVIENLTIDQELDKRALVRVMGGICLEATRCGPADEPLPEHEGPIGIPVTPDSLPVVAELKQERLS
jgi:hypothetical protein